MQNRTFFRLVSYIFWTCSLLFAFNFSSFGQCSVSLDIQPGMSVCDGDTVTFTAIGGGFVKYFWADQTQPNKFDSITGVSIKRAILAPGYQGIILKARNASGCMTPTVTSGFITAKPIPIINPTASPNSICPGQSANLSAEGADSYEWKLIDGTVISSNQTTTVSPAATTTYVVIGTGFNGCTNDSMVIVNVKPANTQIISLVDSVCYGSRANLIGSGATTYSWTIQGNPTVLSTSQGFTPIISKDTTYVLTGTNSFGCTSTDTARIIKRNKPVVSIVANNAAICPGDVLRLSGRGALSYNWAYKTDPTNFISADSVFFDSPQATVIYLSLGTDRYGCKDTAELAITVYPKPATISILGIPYVCPGASNVPYAPSQITTGSIYKWTINPGNTPATQTANTATFNFGATGTASITMQETDLNGCKGNVANYQVTINPALNPPVPEGSDSICTASATGINYKSPYNTPGSTYTWHITGGTITSGNGTANITVNWTATGVNAGKLWYDEHSSASAGCDGTSDTLLVSIFPTPNTGAIIGDNSVCKGSIEVYTVNSSNTSNYAWTVDAGGTINTGQGTRFIEINWSTTGSKLVTVTETSQEGCQGVTQNLSVTVNPLPTLSPSDIIGDSLVCLSTTNAQVYYIKSTTAKATSTYNWSVLGGTIQSSNGNDTITVNWDFNTSTLHNISVFEINQDSCISNTIAKPITLDGETPEIMVVSVNSKNDREVNITWKTSYINGQLNTYNLYKRIHNNSSPNNTWQLIAQDYMSTSYEDRNVNTNDYSYEYKYTIKDACDSSSTSAPHNSILLKAQTDQTTNTIKLNWNRYNNWKEGVSRYEVWRRLDQESSYSLYREVGQDTSFSSQNGHDGFVHCYKIRAIEKTSGTESWSNDTCVNFNNLINIPSAFSPNGDGVNDTWVIRNAEAYKNISVEVFNRWGERVFSSTKGYLNTWDGTLNTKNIPDATYYYVIKLNQFIEGQKEVYSGTVTIVR